MQTHNPYFLIGRDAFLSGEWKVARKHYKNAVRYGSASARHNLGVMLLHGQGCVVDYDEACRLFKESAFFGICESMNQLGYMAYYGKGAPQDYFAARSWFLSSNMQGSHPYAQYHLGLMSALGQGVPQDWKEAAKWLTLSSDQGYAPALYNLGVLYFNGDGVRQSFDLALELYARAAAKGHAGGENNFAVMCAEGLGTLKQPLKNLIPLYERAAAKNVSEAQFNLVNAHLQVDVSAEPLQTPPMRALARRGHDYPPPPGIRAPSRPTKASKPRTEEAPRRGRSGGDGYSQKPRAPEHKRAEEIPRRGSSHRSGGGHSQKSRAAEQKRAEEIPRTSSHRSGGGHSQKSRPAEQKRTEEIPRTSSHRSGGHSQKSRPAEQKRTEEIPRRGSSHRSGGDGYSQKARAAEQKPHRSPKESHAQPQGQKKSPMSEKQRDTSSSPIEAGVVPKALPPKWQPIFVPRQSSRRFKLAGVNAKLPQTPPERQQSQSPESRELKGPMEPRVRGAPQSKFYASTREIGVWGEDSNTDSTVVGVRADTSSSGSSVQTISAKTPAIHTLHTPEHSPIAGGHHGPGLKEKKKVPLVRLASTNFKLSPSPVSQPAS